MKTVLITGASFGIGFELAKIFAANRFDLLLVARSKDKLKEIAQEFAGKYNISTKYLAVDLSLTDSTEKIYDFTRQNNLTIDILINNAGYGVYGSFRDTDLRKEIEMINVNITALVKLTKLFLPGMIERNGGKILNLASTAAFQPGPLMSIYYASKAFVLNFSEAIGYELKNSAVTVSVLCPGPTATGFQAAAKMERSRLFKLVKPMDAGLVARTAYNGLMKGKRIIIPGMLNKITASAHRFFPRKFIVAAMRLIQQ